MTEHREMHLSEVKYQLECLFQARVGWARAEAYANDVTAWMRRQGITVWKEVKDNVEGSPRQRRERDSTDQA